MIPNFGNNQGIPPLRPTTYATAGPIAMLMQRQNVAMFQQMVQGQLLDPQIHRDLMMSSIANSEIVQQLQAQNTVNPGSQNAFMVGHPFDVNRRMSMNSLSSSNSFASEQSPSSSFSANSLSMQLMAPPSIKLPIYNGNNPFNIPQAMPNSAVSQTIYNPHFHCRKCKNHGFIQTRRAGHECLFDQCQCFHCREVEKKRAAFRDWYNKGASKPSPNSEQSAETFEEAQNQMLFAPIHSAQGAHRDPRVLVRIRDQEYALLLQPTSSSSNQGVRAPQIFDQSKANLETARNRMLFAQILSAQGAIPYTQGLVRKMEQEYAALLQSASSTSNEVSADNVSFEALPVEGDGQHEMSDLKAEGPQEEDDEDEVALQHIQENVEDKQELSAEPDVGVNVSLDIESVNCAVAYEEESSPSDNSQNLEIPLKPETIVDDREKGEISDTSDDGSKSFDEDQSLELSIEEQATSPSSDSANHILESMEAQTPLIPSSSPEDECTRDSFPGASNLPMNDGKESLPRHAEQEQSCDEPHVKPKVYKRPIPRFELLKQKGVPERKWKQWCLTCLAHKSTKNHGSRKECLTRYCHTCPPGTQCRWSQLDFHHALDLWYEEMAEKGVAPTNLKKKNMEKKQSAKRGRYLCKKCRNHGVESFLKGHVCPKYTCKCLKCRVVDMERQMRQDRVDD